jgi:hypothetical protein
VTEQQTAPEHTRTVLTHLANWLALTAPTTPLSHTGLTIALKRALAAEGLPHATTEAVTPHLPVLSPNTTVGQYVGQLRETARGL